MSHRIDTPTGPETPFIRIHGRITWRGDDADTPVMRPRSLTPVTTDLQDQVAAMREFVRKRDAFGDDHRKRLASVKRLPMWLMFGLLVLLACGGCAHQQAPGAIVLPERVGSVAALAVTAAVGQEPKAATLPGPVTIVFQPKDASDVCLVDAHEGQHREDMREMGTQRFLRAYVDQYVECVTEGRSRPWCLREMPLEKLAYRRQHECEAARAAGRPWPPVSQAPRWRDGWGMCMRKGGAR